MMLTATGYLLLLGALIACDPADAPADKTGKNPEKNPGDTAPPPAQDILRTDLTLDLETLSGQAGIGVIAGGGPIRLEVGGLEITSVTLDGAAADWRVKGGQLTVPAAPGTRQVDVDYRFQAYAGFRGWIPERGLTFVWPYYCSNLFPCDPDPADGLQFSMAVTGYAPGLTAIYPAEIPADAPSYMPGIAIGDYTRTDLGTTSGGVQISVWSLPGRLDAAMLGTAHLTAAFDYLERTYGPWRFGDHAGSVEVDWNNHDGVIDWSDVGGIEHHPFWHIASFSMPSEEVHIHEAAHGWFGDGVRFACWEDLVLSEGTTTYITAQAARAVGAPDFFPMYVDELETICRNDRTNTAAMPGTCGEIDILTDPLWSMIPYMKGACFYKEVADLIGEEELDQVIAAFYAEHAGGAATMQDMIDDLRAATPADSTATLNTLVREWLQTKDCPPDYAARCSR